MHETLDIDHMRAFLTKFSGFKTRYYRSETGKQSQHFLYQTIQEVSF
jgi:leucyl aminopeptidase